MFGVSFPELLVIFAVILIVFGPEKLPEGAQAFGKFMGTLKRSSDSIRREFYNAIYKPAEEITAQVRAQASDELRGLSFESEKQGEPVPSQPASEPSLSKPSTSSAQQEVQATENADGGDTQSQTKNEDERPKSIA